MWEGLSKGFLIVSNYCGSYLFPQFGMMMGCTLILAYKGHCIYGTEALVVCDNKRGRVSSLLPSVISKKHYWRFTKYWVLQ